MNFYKLQGAGNDYIYIDGIRERLPFDFERLIPLLCDRHYGIGGDGVILLTAADGADIGMKMWNQDGSRGAMCGNGIRCLARLAYELGYAGLTQEIKTDSGLRWVKLSVKDGEILGAEVEMGRADFALQNIPCTAQKSPIYFQIDGENHSFTPVSMGNPHMTTFVDNFDKYWQFDGAALTKNTYFPNGVNVGVGKILGQNELALRVFERGSGETLACGTGACAAVAVGVSLGHFCAGVPVTVHMRGGVLSVCERADKTLTLYGDCKPIYKGEWYGEYLESAF